MALSITKLRRQFEIHTWRKIIEENPYIAVVQVTGGRSWGRSNMKARILGEQMSDPDVSARYAVPRAAREGVLQTQYGSMAPLFRTCGSAVVYGRKVDPVVQVVKRAKAVLDGGLLVGGRFGESVVTARVWDLVLQSEGEVAEWAQLFSVLGRRPAVVDLLDRSSSGLFDAVREGGRAQRLSHMLDQIGEGKGGG